MSIVYCTALSEWFITVAAETLAISVLGWLCLKMVESRPPPVRSGVVLITLVAMLLIPVVSTTSRIGQWHWLTASIPVAEPFPTTPQVESELAVPNDEHNPIADTRPDITPVTPSTDSVSTATPDAPVKMQHSERPITPAMLINCIGTIWLLGTLLFVSRLIIDILSVNRFWRDAIELSDQRTRETMVSIWKPWWPHRQPRVYLSPKASSPIVVGCVRPRIVLPSGVYADLSDDQLRHVLLHESAHVYHRDPLLAVVQRLSVAFAWWNPIVYRLNAQLSQFRETISDNYAIADDAKSYAHSLVALAEKLAFSRQRLGTFGIAGSHVQLEDRLKAILNGGRNMEKRLNTPTAFILCLLSIAMLTPVVGLRISLAKGDANTQAATPPPSETMPSTEATLNATQGSTKSSIDRVPSTPTAAHVYDITPQAHATSMISPETLRAIPIVDKDGTEISVDGVHDLLIHAFSLLESSIQYDNITGFNANRAGLIRGEQLVLGRARFPDDETAPTCSAHVERRQGEYLPIALPNPHSSNTDPTLIFGKIRPMLPYDRHLEVNVRKLGYEPAQVPLHITKSQQNQIIWLGDVVMTRNANQVKKDIRGNIIIRGRNAPPANGTMSLQVRDIAGPGGKRSTPVTDGTFEFNGVPQGNYTMSSELSGYWTEMWVVKVTERALPVLQVEAHRPYMGTIKIHSEESVNEFSFACALPTEAAVKIPVQDTSLMAYPISQRPIPGRVTVGHQRDRQVTKLTVSGFGRYVLAKLDSPVTSFSEMSQRKPEHQFNAGVVEEGDIVGCYDSKSNQLVSILEFTDIVKSRSDSRFDNVYKKVHDESPTN